MWVLKGEFRMGERCKEEMFRNKEVAFASFGEEKPGERLSSPGGKYKDRFSLGCSHIFLCKQNRQSFSLPGQHTPCSFFLSGLSLNVTFSEKEY